MIVYRGQTMFADQINKFKQNVGGFLSFNNFLSTSLEKDVPQNLNQKKLKFYLKCKSIQQ
jgi:hypothetical protein